MKTVKMEKVDENFIKQLMNEIDILKKLDHPNILKFYEYYAEKNKFYIITEILEGGSVSSFFK